MSPLQVFACRRKAIRSGEIVVLTRGSEAAAQSFAPVEVARENGARADGLEIVIGEITLPTLSPGSGKTKSAWLWTFARDDRTFGGTAPPMVDYC
ncbi:hypothetical protein [Mesorhizobium abyssinicae]|uniref:hypothetical protein n=1 Tax=Mesorhizobium abyssinicae TaxID=1209958 RepID=UPI003397E140